jgi:endogenous inhibitor of DNA gyrase (YacG/DUF329 family)
MKENTQKVVKCAPCDKYFGYTEDNKNCPFCHTEYSELVERTKMVEAYETVELDAKDLPDSGQGRKETPKTQKKSFKMWKDAKD